MPPRINERTNSRILILLCFLPLASCDWMGRQADALGEHMPVIGERCEHWQCVTSSGQAQSDYNKAMQQRQHAPQPAPQASPAPAAAPTPYDSYP